MWDFFYWIDLNAKQFLYCYCYISMSNTEKHNTENTRVENNTSLEKGPCTVQDCNCTGFIPNHEQEDICDICSHKYADHK